MFLKKVSVQKKVFLRPMSTFLSFPMAVTYKQLSLCTLFSLPYFNPFLTLFMLQAAGEHSLLLTLTDGHLGEDNFITQPLLILVEDTNDNSPVFVSVPQGMIWKHFSVTPESSVFSMPNLTNQRAAFTIYANLN